LRVASLQYSGHCVSWDYPLVMANSSYNVSVSPDSSLFQLDDEFHRIIYFSGTSYFLKAFGYEKPSSPTLDAYQIKLTNSGN
jgi:hypothetical protein